MHSYRDTDGWEVYFDGGQGPLNVIKTFNNERDAAMYAHYLNGGEVPDIFLRAVTQK